MKYDLMTVVKYDSPDFNLEEAINLAKQPQPDMSAIFLLSDIAHNGYGLPIEEVSIFDGRYWTELGARHQDPLCQAKGGAMSLLGRGGPRNSRQGEEYIKQSRDWLVNAANKGHPYAQSILGVLYNHGLVFPKNPQLVLELYQKAAMAGELNAIHNMGLLYVHGADGLAPNLEKGREWLRLAAVAKYANAQFILGTTYIKSSPQQIEEGIGWLTGAASQGYSDAQIYLAECYDGKYYTDHDYMDPDRAFYWYKKAADAGDASSGLIVATRILNARRMVLEQKLESSLADESAAASDTLGLCTIADAYAICAKIACAEDSKEQRKAAQIINSLKISATKMRADDSVSYIFADGSCVREEPLKNAGRPAIKKPRHKANGLRR